MAFAVRSLLFVHGDDNPNMLTQALYPTRTRAFCSRVFTLPPSVYRVYRAFHVQTGESKVGIYNYPGQHPLIPRSPNPVLMPSPVMAPVRKVTAWLGRRWVHNLPPRLPGQYVVPAPVIRGETRLFVGVTSHVPPFSRYLARGGTFISPFWW